MKPDAKSLRRKVDEVLMNRFGRRLGRATGRQIAVAIREAKVALKSRVEIPPPLGHAQFFQIDELVQ